MIVAYAWSIRTEPFSGRWPRAITYPLVLAASAFLWFVIGRSAIAFFQALQ